VLAGWACSGCPRQRDQSHDLLRLLSELEKQGRWRALNRGDSRDPFAGRLAALGIESVYAFPAKHGREGIVRVDPGFYFGREWGREAIDTWLGGFLASDTGANKLGKLDRARHASERHLVIVLHSLSQAGMGIPLGLTDRDEPGAAPYVMPSLVPPEPLTHTWLLPTGAASEGLRWTRHDGWMVLQGSAA
jgi:hypothetical protein